MILYLSEYTNFFRLAMFLLSFVICAFLEHSFPKRKLSESRAKRWPDNLLLLSCSSAAAALFFKIFFIVNLSSLAQLVLDRGWGVFHYFSLNKWLAFVLSIVIMDFIIYWQHRLFHKVKFLWRFHKVHHADLDLDVTSGNRFHPVEIVFSLCIKILSIVVFGIDPFAVIVFEIILNSMAQFNHSNIELGRRLDAFLRIFVVTPDFHRPHHSVIEKELNQNFGFNLSCWDYFFGTYLAEPSKGHAAMQIGLNKYRKEDQLRLWNLLIMPFTKKTS